MNSDTQQDARLSLLKAWLQETLPGAQPPQPASSDASFRRYFRVFSDQNNNLQGKSTSFVVMDAPPPQEDCRPFVQVAEALVQAGVRAPRVLAHDLEQGFLLLDDLGDMTFLAALPEQDPDAAYRRAIDELLRIQQVPNVGLPDYDRALLQREVALFHNWYLGVHRRRLLRASEQKAWDTACELLIDAALAQPQVFVHRDYHSRNLMWADSGALGVLDFQDAVWGALSYDLVSLLRDCYVAWPDPQIDAWVESYHQQALDVGLAIPELEQFRRDFDWMGVQRHLKAVGIFARLNHRDGKSGYLNDIPRTLNYLATVAARYPELEIIHQLAVDSLHS